MPTYDYRCAACGHRLEIFHGIAEKPRKTCPECKKPRLERLISAGAGLVFKGSGFYLTDYRSESYKAGEKREKGAGQSNSGDAQQPAAARSDNAGASEKGASEQSAPEKGKPVKGDSTRAPKPASEGGTKGAGTRGSKPGSPRAPKQS